MKLFVIGAVFSFCSLVAGAAERARTPFPVVDSDTQKARDETRKQILEDEMTVEAARLSKAKVDLAKARDSNLSTSEIGSLTDALRRHEVNIASLGHEISRAKGGQKAVSKPARIGVVSDLAPEQPKSIRADAADINRPAPFWDVYRRQASNQPEGETETKLQLSAN